MRPSNNGAGAAVTAALFFIFSGIACADAAPRDGMPRAYVGIEGLSIVGVHRDIDGSQYGLGGGPLLEIRGGSRRVALHAEGIPVVSIPGTRPSVKYGQATPKLGIFNGQVEYALDARGRQWVGVGTTIYNQRTPLPNLQQLVTSRLAGIRYTLRYRMPLRRARFIEAFAGAAPALFGSDYFAYSDGVTAPVTKDERASEVDASVCIGWDQKTNEWLLGMRAVNFSAKFIRVGDAADRNVGIGAMLEWRRIIR